MSLFRIIDKLFLMLFTFPPAYFVYRFFRWYLNTEPVAMDPSDFSQPEERQEEELESS